MDGWEQIDSVGENRRGTRECPPAGRVLGVDHLRPDLNGLESRRVQR